MGAFLQTYGSWIIFGALFILMFRMHVGGHGGGGAHDGHGGCGMEHGQSEEHVAQEEQRQDHAERVVPVDQPSQEEPAPDAVRGSGSAPTVSDVRRSAQCH